MKRSARTLLLLAALFTLTGCAGAPTFITPNSSISADQAGLYRILIVLSILVFVFVEAWLVYNIVRFRRRDGDDSLPKQVYGNNRLEIIWTALPLLLVGVLFWLTVSTVNAVSAPAPLADDLNLQVVGHQWWWEFDYPDLGILTANELHVPAGKTVQITLFSNDVIHSFWIPQLSGKVDVIPGQTNHLWFKADSLGEFHGQCAEFCGLNHANMRIKVVVESQADFEAWVANQQKPPAAPQTDLQKKGYDLVTGGICNSCHTLGEHKSEKESNPQTPAGPGQAGIELAARGVGPNLTHLMSRSVFAGATYELNETNLHRWLQDNQSMKPGNDMSVNPSASDIEALIAYLTTLK